MKQVEQQRVYELADKVRKSKAPGKLVFMWIKQDVISYKEFHAILDELGTPYWYE